VNITDFQGQVRRWVVQCFGTSAADSKQERGYRFLEEALELAQAGGVTEAEARAMVAHVYSRPVGELVQEVGGSVLTLAALCAAYCVNLEAAAVAELTRAKASAAKIREKQSTKPLRWDARMPTDPPEPPPERSARRATHNEVDKGTD